MRLSLPTGSSGRSAGEIAVTAARLAEREIAVGFTKAKRLRYKGIRDIVTDTDVAAEKAIMDLLHQEFPSHTFLAEESGATGKPADYQWIIDPLDGTLNYSQTIPVFCTAIALAYHDEVLLAVINDPLRKELFVAIKGQGATLNGTPIAVSSKTDLTSAVVGFDLGYDEAGRKRAMEQAYTLLPIVRTIRLIGSAALALAYTAAGRFDVFYHNWLFPWDLAAGCLLISEAGGLATDWEKNPPSLASRALVASNHTLHGKVLETLGKAPESAIFP